MAFLTTALFRQLVEHRPGDLRRVGQVLTGGEAMSPALARAAAWELGIRGATATHPIPSHPASWLPLVRRFIELNGTCRASSAANASRVKQWLRLANQGGRLPWFDALKASPTLEALLDKLGRLAAERDPCTHIRAEALSA